MCLECFVQTVSLNESLYSCRTGYNGPLLLRKAIMENNKQSSVLSEEMHVVTYVPW